MTNDVLAAVHGEDEVRSAIALMKHVFFSVYEIYSAYEQLACFSFTTFRQRKHLT